MRLSRRFMIIAGLVVFTIGPLLTATSAQAASSSDEAFRQRKVIARWHITGKNQLEAAYRRGVDVLEDHPDLRRGYFTVLTSEEELAALRADGFTLDVVNHDWYETYAAGAQVPNGGFRNYSQCLLLMDSIQAAHPSITTEKLFLGITNDGNTLWGMKISDNPGIDEAEPEVLFTGMHHAREPIGMEICLETMKRLTDGYGTDTLLTRLVNEREMYFIPVVNPDGFEYNRLTNPNGGGMWRKNRTDNGNGTWGIDVNRNYGYHWGYDDEGSSPFPGYETYRGVFGFSELETQAVRDFVNAHEFIFMINYHSYSNLYLWPWGYDQIYTPDNALFQTIGDSLAQYNGYTPQVGWELYVTNGDSDDWAYGATGEHPKIYSITPEVGEWFWPDPSEIPGQIEENQGPNLVIIDLAETPERVYPPAQPVWTTADTFFTPDYSLTWTDPGGLNGAVSFTVMELFGGYEKTDNAEGAPVDWNLSGFTQVSNRAASATSSYYGGYADGLRARMTASEFRKVKPGDVLQLKVWYDIEQDYDYAYVEISTDGGASFATLPGNITTDEDPNGNNRGNGITGFSGGGFVTGTFNLGAYAGQQALIRLSYETDGGVLEEGVYFDDIGPLQGYDSTKTLATTPTPNHAIVGALGGNHYYWVQSTDTDGQKSRVTPPNQVVAYIPVYGDLDNDQTIDVLDLSGLIDYIFAGGQGALIGGAEECNGVAGVNVLDIVYLIDYLFRGGPAPIGLT